MCCNRRRQARACCNGGACRCGGGGCRSARGPRRGGPITLLIRTIATKVAEHKAEKQLLASTMASGAMIAAPPSSVRQLHEKRPEIVQSTSSAPSSRPAPPAYDAVVGTQSETAQALEELDARHRAEREELMNRQYLQDRKVAL